MPAIQPAIRAYLQETFTLASTSREEMILQVYAPHRPRFLGRVAGAVSINLLLREEDVQILYGFDTLESAKSFLESAYFGETDDLLAKYRKGSAALALYAAHD